MSSENKKAKRFNDTPFQWHTVPMPMLAKTHKYQNFYLKNVGQGHKDI